VLSLVMNPGGPEEQAFVLSPGTVTIGRTSDNQVVCVHKSLSRKHAQVDYDGRTLRVLDLQSKNGIYFNGRRVATCEPLEGDRFRCGDITFLVEATTARQPRVAAGMQTLPSPLALDAAIRQRTAVVSVESEEQRHKDRLFLLIRASELLVGTLPLDRVLDELVVLAVQTLAIDRLALLAIDDETLEVTPTLIKTFAGASPRPYSTRVVDWVIEKSSPASFADVSRDTTLPGDPAEDSAIRAAMAVPINQGSEMIGVLYGDSVSHAGAFRADDLALFRAIANMTAVVMERDALGASKPDPPTLPKR
jgi:adenylate cyclase